ncbi:DUF4383 domain-containing protein [Arthrobacter crystallopoietes]|uniref:DUF4383 domain-containing protein n=1 Tax=Crystallibacter crystallopoietes TaxID=37928 RepID=UPI001ABE4240|nr:DUF4383 domain-containing protein [Arthrobacter crystallopoietes]QTG82689.1 DUF4383 domain-containing protein [Arthrobacter crystallopoietes]
MTTSDQTSIREGKRTSVQTVTLAVGAVFLLVGILGFVPGITSGVDQLTFAGHQSGAMLLGLFQVSILHNIVHLLFGAVGLALSRSWSGSRSYLIWGGAIYLVLWIYGLVIGHESPANFVPLNTADNWLHFVLGVAMLGLGVLLGRGHTATKA